MGNGIDDFKFDQSLSDEVESPFFVSFGSL
jgi:hypothetical protein